ncbi:hypothetical protein V1264_002560 [Littorina saxatilis]|uniref:gamma-glutamylcyclotransferase n=3 Tax=Littorina saxatilis TaxID=31220 RepID=A0AAN9G7B3_9CAEN
MAAARTFLYFSFGSNLLRQRLQLANPSAVFKTVGKLEDFELVFVGQSGRWQGGVASIEEKKGGEVYGVVWTLNREDIPTLDKQEGIYTPMEVEVAGMDGGRYTCRTYQLRIGWPPGPPSPHYKDVIIRGARQNSLPDHYLKYLESIKDNGFQGDVPVYNDVMRLLENQ